MRLENKVALISGGARGMGAVEAELPTEPRPGAAYIKVTPHRIRSWDYSADSA